MQQDNQKSSVDNKLRRHKSNKTKYFKYKYATKNYTVEKKNATDAEKNAYDSVIKHQKPAYDDTNIGTHISTSHGKRKIIIVDEQAEIERTKNENAINFALVMFTVIAFVVTVIMLVNFFFSTDIGSSVLRHLQGSSGIKGDDYVFGKFENQVTIGDSYDTVISLLGFPDAPQEEDETLFMYYGESYIIIEDETVVGYYKKPGSDFKITVGDAKKDITRMIFVGDGAKRVVDKLGSPDHYLKHTWIYYGIDVDYVRTNVKNGKTLTINFNDNYEVASFKLE